jgi:hypothetical protein
VGYVVKEADIRRDKEILLNIIRANRTRQEFPYEKRYNWLYFENPYGPATAWIIWDETKEYPAGFTAVYPRKMLVKGSAAGIAAIFPSKRNTAPWGSRCNYARKPSAMWTKVRCRFFTPIPTIKWCISI